MGVEISGASIRVLSDELIQGVLAHEFLHYVHATLSIHQSRHSGSVAIGPGVGYLNNWSTHRRHDASTQVSPEEWLSKRLAGLAERIEDDSSIEITEALSWLWTGWVEADYPVERGVRQIDEPQLTMVIDEDSIARAMDFA